MFDDFGKVSDDRLEQEERASRSTTLLWATAWSGGRLGQERVRTRRWQFAGDIEWCEQKRVKDALTRRRGPKRRGKNDNSD
jgi:hypothetical protein